MCTLYNVTTNAEAMRQLYKVTSPSLPNLPIFGDIYPNREGPVVRHDAEGRREIATMLWGFPPPDHSAKPVVNVRNLASPFWRAWLNKPEHRCLVPVERFSEWTSTPDPATGRKRKVWFAVDGEDEVPFAFAGIWRPGFKPDEPPRYAFLTTMANSFVAKVHPKAMPVILAREDYDQWMRGSYADATALARAFPSERMTLVDA
jgi:putative SOS response-associated peptidase YedK